MTETKPVPYAIFGWAVRARRQKLRWKQLYVASSLGYTVQHWKKIERGMHLPEYQRYREILGFLGLAEIMESLYDCVRPDAPLRR